MPGTTGNQATLTWPAVTCDKVRVYFGKTNVAGGQSKVFIDNVDVTSTGTLGGNGLSGASTANIQHSGGSKSGGYYWELGVAGGSHTVKVQSTANGGVAVIHGVEFFNGDAAAGLRHGTPRTREPAPTTASTPRWPRLGGLGYLGAGPHRRHDRHQRCELRVRGHLQDEPDDASSARSRRHPRPARS